MSHETDAFALVVERLKREREEIDNTIALLEARISGGRPPEPAETKAETDKDDDQEADEANNHNPPEKEGEFLGMTVATAARIALNRRRKLMSPFEITAELVRGGLPVSNSKTVASILSRRSRSIGDFVSPKRGQWGLKEWYPRRSFGKTEEPDRGEEATEPSEPEQLSEPTQIVPLRTNGEP